jgi:hypothetical protein
MVFGCLRILLTLLFIRWVLPPRMEQQRVLAHPVEVGLNGSQGAATGRPAPYGSAQA